MIHPRTTSRKKVLLVEDHPLFREMLAQLVEKDLGHKVCGQADNIQRALALIEQTQPDAAVVDLSLKGPGGLELVKDTAARKLGVRVLILSMHEEGVYAERALRAGASGYISKLEPASEIADAIRTILDGRIYVSRAVNQAILERHGRRGQTLAATGVDLLSDRELEVFQLLGSGLNSRGIAGRLNLEATTVDSYRARIKEKLGVKNAAELYQRASQWLAGTARVSG